MNKLITPEVIHASDLCGKELAEFIQYVRKVDPKLRDSEAILVGGIILHHLPIAFASNPEMLTDLKKTCETVKKRRK